MPTVNIPRLGIIEYEKVPLPAGVKGKTLTGLPTAPILITPEKLPQAKLEHVVAHEVAHRNLLKIFERAARENPDILDAPDVESAIVRFLEDEGVDIKTMPVKSPVIRHMIDTAPRNGYIRDGVTAGEIVAEAYALSMTGEQRMPDSVERVFQEASNHHADSASMMPLVIGGGLLAALILIGRR